MKLKLAMAPVPLTLAFKKQRQEDQGLAAFETPGKMVTIGNAVMEVTVPLRSSTNGHSIGYLVLLHPLFSLKHPDRVLKFE